MGKLTARTVETAKGPGYFADGQGLYLQIKAGGGRSWIYRYQIDGRRRDMGLGPVNTVTLLEARERAHAARKLVRDKTDPIEKRRAAVAAARLERAKLMIFQQCAEEYIQDNRSGWKNAKHAAQWTASLKTYANPVFGTVAVGDVDLALVTKVLRPIWATKTETAARLRGRIENILDWASTNGYRTGENPARWYGHLENILPRRSKVRKVEHHAALPYAEIGAFIQTLRAQDGVSAKALEFAILTAARTGEVIGATWDEIDLAARRWTVPASRMKAEREHIVPLSDAALNILRTMKDKSAGPFVFPGGKANKPLSNMALLMQLRRMARDDLTAYGFRSTFRDWAAEKTTFQNEVAEMALAHMVSDKVEAAYRRGDLFEKRQKLMNAWATYCTTPETDAKIIPIGAGHR